MKELEQLIKDQLSTQAEAPVRKNQFLGQLHPKPGHRTFELNRTTGEIAEAKLEMTAIIGLAGKPGVQKRIKVKPSCLYVTALHKQSSVKHFIRLMQTTLPKLAAHG